MSGSGYGRVITNTFAGVFEQYYLLYIHDVTDPNTTTDVVLAYDTIKKIWTVYTGGFTNFFHLNGFENFRYGGRANQFYSSLWGGNDGGQMFRFFDYNFVDINQVKQEGDVFPDLLSNTGSPVSALIETPLYDLTHPELFKKFNRIRVYTEQGRWNFEYRVHDDKGIGQYKNLGSVDKPIDFLRFPKEAQGYRVGFRITSANTAAQSIFNGFVLEDTEVISRQ